MNIASRKVVASAVIVLIMSLQAVSAQTDHGVRIRNLLAYADTSSHELHISFDTEGTVNTGATSSLSVRLFSPDGMEMFLQEVSLAENERNLKPGPTKKLTIDYPAFIHDIADYTVELVTTLPDSVDIWKLVNAVNPDRIRNDIGALAKQRNHHTAEGLKNLAATDNLINENFRKYGLKATRFQFRDANNVTGADFIGELRGIGNAVQAVILSAHYDTVKDSPGVDDNLSGIAGMLEVMRVLSEYSFDRTIDFIAFGMEEEGLVGSRHFVRGGIPLNRRVYACMNFDMIGYASGAANSQKFPDELKEILPAAYEFVSNNDFKGDFILATHNSQSSFIAATFTEMSRKYEPDLKVLSVSAPENPRVPAFDAGDHFAFWELKYPALSIGDTADARNPNYHSPTDTVETINIDLIANVVKASIASLARLAGIRHAYRIESQIFISESVAGQ